MGTEETEKNTLNMGWQVKDGGSLTFPCGTLVSVRFRDFCSSKL